MMFARGFGYGNNFMNGGWGFVVMAVILIVAALLITAIVLLLRKSQLNKTYSQGLTESTELLKSRFVKGEITEDEYTRMKKLLYNK